MPKPTPLGQALKDWGKLLTLRSTPEIYDRLSVTHLALGFLGTWAVGIARNWDYPEALPAARMGLYSLAYIVAMSFLLFLTAWPLSQVKRNYWHILTLVSLTSAPGLVYGIPVEKWTTLTLARDINVFFLFVVATWRVTMALHMFRNSMQTSGSQAFAAIFLPILAIIASLAFSGRAEYVFQLMGGLRDREPSAHDGANQWVGLLGCLAWPLFLVALIVYVTAIHMMRSKESGGQE